MLLVQTLKHMPKKFVTLILALFCTLGLRAQSADLSGIAHVAFRVNDLAKSRDFYNKLGFEQAFEFTDAGRTSVAFIKVNDRQFIELYPRTADSQPGGLLHICFEASDIESVRGAYLKRELQPAEVKKARAGNILFVMHDPEGQLLEYTQYLPDSLHSMDHAKHLGEHRISDHLLEATTCGQGYRRRNARSTPAALSFKVPSQLGSSFSSLETPAIRWCYNPKRRQRSRESSSESRVFEGPRATCAVEDFTCRKAAARLRLPTPMDLSSRSFPHTHQHTDRFH